MRAAAIYHALLRCYPAPFRDEYGDEMYLTFAEQLNDARRTGRPLRQALVWIEAAGDVLTVAPKEHAHVLFQDLRYAFRTMAARPGFTAVAILSLALGIGANTAIFSLWNGVLHASLPVVQRPDELVILTDPSEAGLWRGTWNGRTDGPRDWLTYTEFEQLRDRADVFSGLMATQSSISTWQVRADGEAWEDARGRLVSGGFFQVLGVGAAAGRVFTADADWRDTHDAVISYGYWQRRFGGRPDVLGRTLTIRNATVTIIGVAARGFVGETTGQQPDLWLPLRLQPSVLPGNNYLRDTPPEKAMWLHVFGRLKPGVSLAEAEARANAIFQADLQSFYGATASDDRGRELLNQRLEVRPAAGGASSMRTELSDSLTALMAGVGVLMLIACANLANLLLARGAARRAEMMLRLSLGAGRGRLVRQLVTESLALAAAGGVAAVAVAYVLYPRARPDARRRRPQLRDRLCLRPAGVGLPGRGNRDRRTPVRPAARVAGYRDRCGSGSQGVRPGRPRVTRADSLGARAGQPATRAVLAASRWRRVAGAHRLQRATDRSRLHDRAFAPRSRRAPDRRRGSGPAQHPAARAARPHSEDPGRERRELLAARRVHRLVFVAIDRGGGPCGHRRPGR